MWGSVWGIDQLSQADLNQSWQANIFCSVHNVDPYNIFSSTLRYNLLTIKCMYFKCTLSISSDKCHSYVVTLPRKNTFPSPLKSSYSRSPLPTPAPLTDLISFFFFSRIQNQCLLEEFEDDKNKWKAIPCSRIGNISIVKMTILPMISIINTTVCLC